MQAFIHTDKVSQMKLKVMIISFEYIEVLFVCLLFVQLLFSNENTLGCDDAQVHKHIRSHEHIRRATSTIKITCVCVWCWSMRL